MSLVQKILSETMASANAPSAGKRDRSPNFPSIGLGRAIERTEQFYKRARRYEVRMADAAASWGMGAKSSGTLQTVAALLAYGLLEDSGSGEARKIKISDLGWRILEDRRPGARERGLAEAALKPKLIADYAEIWRTGRHDDHFCLSELKIERGFTDDAAARFLKVFDETIQFANPASSDTVSDRETGGDRTAEGPAKLPSDDLTPSAPTVKVGDYVQWISGGVEQFKVPRKVVGVFPDGQHAQVFGSNTGVPMNELTVVDAPAAAPLATVAAPATAPAIEASSAGTQGDNDFTVLQRGNRLQITADVDLEGIATLKELLADYESILRRLAGKKSI